jgi:undecaprenyl diphosphate synthase
LPRVVGHRAGREAVRRTLEACRELGIAVLTLYAFSTENWRRSEEEVGALMELLHEAVIAEADELAKHGVRFRTSGDLESLPRETRDALAGLVRRTAANSAIVLNLALNYGGRADIVHAAQSLAREVAAGQRTADSIDEAAVADRLYTAGLPDPDLLVRTGAEQRLSNFLLWQAAYTELVFLDIYWPDFTREHLVHAIAAFQARQRRFGGVSRA